MTRRVRRALGWVLWVPGALAMIAGALLTRLADWVYGEHISLWRRGESPWV